MPVLESKNSHVGNLSKKVIEYFSCYETNDREKIEKLITDEFIFSSPENDRIDRAAYFAKCWPCGIKNDPLFHITRLFEYYNEVFLEYKCQPKSDKAFQNVEIFRFKGDQIREVQVYFENCQQAN